MDEKAYVIRRIDNSSKLGIQFEASEKSPLVNPAIVVENWGKDPISITVDGRLLKPDKDYQLGYDIRLEGTDLIIWLKMESDEPVEVEIK